RIFSTVFSFFFAIPFLYIPFFWFLLLQTAGQKNGISSFLSAYILGYLPFFLVLKLFQFFLKKSGIMERNLDNMTYNRICRLISIGFMVNSFFYAVPNNPITTMYRNYTGTEDYYTQSRGTKQYQALIEGVQPFFETEAYYGREIFLYEIEGELYLEFLESLNPYEEHYAVVKKQPFSSSKMSFDNDEITIYASENGGEKTEENRVLDKKFTVKNVLSDGSDAHFYMNYNEASRNRAEHTTDVVVKLDSTGHFYHMEEAPIYLNPNWPGGGTYAINALFFITFND
ncbi:MAG: hypothetical protein R3Y63_14940, partial [Eubacteriales bacterium]